MTTKLEAAFKKASALSPELQDMIAEQILADLQTDPSTLRRGSHPPNKNSIGDCRNCRTHGQRIQRP